MISERIKANYNEGSGKEFYFWRTYNHQEIDLIEECSDSLTALEFKWGNKKANIPDVFKVAYPNAAFDVINKDNYLNYI